MHLGTPSDQALRLEVIHKGWSSVFVRLDNKKLTWWELRPSRFFSGERFNLERNGKMVFQGRIEKYITPLTEVAFHSDDGYKICSFQAFHYWQGDIVTISPAEEKVPTERFREIVWKALTSDSKNIVGAYTPR